MNDHLGILQQWVHAKPVGGNRTRQTGKGQCLEVEQKKKEDLDAGQNGRRKGGQPEAGCVPQANDEAEPCQQPRPQQQRSLLARPERGELVRCGERAVGFVQDVGEGEVIVEDRPQSAKTAAETAAKPMIPARRATSANRSGEMRPRRPVEI
jgi:hypothetical protein